MSFALGAQMTASSYYYLKLAQGSFENAKYQMDLRMENFMKYMLVSSSRTIEDIKGKYEVIK